MAHHRPIFHIMPERGWVNDPNGPVHYRGMYHLFYQSIPDSTNWDWRMQWGHATSKNLVHWSRLENVLKPTQGFQDANGCWSGCCAISDDGTPTILYTGVALRSNESVPLPEAGYDLGIRMIEAQCFATPESSDDPLLRRWKKADRPFLPLPPRGLPITGWRDPFVASSPYPGGSRRLLLLGSGFRGAGGALLKYGASGDIMDPWNYEGVLIRAESDKFGEVWECPVLVPISRESGPDLGSSLAAADSDDSQARGSAFRGHLGGVGMRPAPSPPSDRLPDHPATSEQLSSHILLAGEHFPDEAVPRYHPVLYWLGRLEDGEFTPERSEPRVFDHGDVVYAPNALVDGDGRAVLWVWVHEGACPDRLDYSGCMSAPRVLSLDPRGRLVQRPLAELDRLRRGEGWRAEGMEVGDSQAVAIPAPLGDHLDLDVSLRFPSPNSWGGILIKSRVDDECLVLFLEPQIGTFTTCRVMLRGDQVDWGAVWDERRVSLEDTGGAMLEIGVRVLVDGSVVETFLSTGEAISRRFYRGPCEDGSAGVCFVAGGAGMQVVRAGAWEMGGIWEEGL